MRDDELRRFDDRLYLLGVDRVAFHDGVGDAVQLCRLGRDRKRRFAKRIQRHALIDGNDATGVALILERQQRQLDHFIGVRIKPSYLGVDQHGPACLTMMCGHRPFARGRDAPEHTIIGAGAEEAFGFGEVHAWRS